MKTILIVEDEKDIAEMLSVFLENEGYRTVSAYDGLEGLRLFGKERADLVILDILLPKLDGFSLCKEIRRKSDVPMIMLTALSDEDSQIKGYNLMIDEYVTKPFSIGVFLKKVAAVLRRRENPRTELLSWGDISMDRESHTVKVKEQEVYLTGREFELLALFLADPHRIMTKDYIMEKLWKYEYGCEDGIIYTHIKNLRKKIGEDVIKTIRGVGYKLD
ncbi:MAG TPA: response regulator transcription factor [Candidatus Blautia pullistercoris]|uniref:Stage 0 sporulation protein A homolog n=1 Tax=Candidatus Blautia pullistercoris TaxID=2838499 RepID=A0A9D2AMG2_9FIRM|nr:response regulator transcription factor [Candidatus Blautia pullistercoris]